MGPAEVVGMVQHAHCCRRRLLRRELEFHVCTINKIAHTKKAGNLSYAPCICDDSQNHIQGSYDKFPDFFRSDIQNCRRLLKIQYVIAIYLMRWLNNFYGFRFKWTATGAIGIHPTKAWLSQLVNFKNQSDTLEEQYAIKYCFKLGKRPQKRMECFELFLDHLAWIEHQFLSGIRDSRKAGSLWGMVKGVGGVRMSIHQNWLAKGLGLGLLC